MPDRSFADYPLKAFLDQLAGDAPAPGGGTVAALTAALAANLARMAAAFTLNNERFADAHPPVRRIAERLTIAADALVGLMDEDAAAFAQLQAAFARRKDDPGRRQGIEQAAALAAAAPLEVATFCRRIQSDLRELESLANPHLHSDVRCGAHLARAALSAALENVKVNLPFLSSEAAERVRAELARQQPAEP